MEPPAGQGHTASVLANAAFGDAPGCWPLPAATTPRDLWLRAVIAGGQGHYGCAFTDIAALHRIERTGPLVSLAHSTGGSFLRQLGWHARARGSDGHAWACGHTDPEAGADALIGLAADALGVGRFAASERLLQRAHAMAPDSGRLPVRLAWVSAELAMARGDGTTAVVHARRGVEAAGEFGSARHVLKSDVVLAAALCASGAVEESRRVADSALAAAGPLGMVPLRWALTCLLADIGSATHSSAEALGLRDECADILRRRGGVWP